MKIAMIMFLTANLNIDPVTYKIQLIKIVDTYVMIMLFFFFTCPAYINQILLLIDSLQNNIN